MGLWRGTASSSPGHGALPGDPVRVAKCMGLASATTTGRLRVFDYVSGGIPAKLGPGSRQALQEQHPPGCGRRRPLSDNLAKDGEVVITIHGEEFTVKQFRKEVTVSQPVGPGSHRP